MNFDKDTTALLDLDLALCIESDVYAFRGAYYNPDDGIQLSWTFRGEGIAGPVAFVDGTTYSVAVVRAPANQAPVIGGQDTVAIGVAENTTGDIGSPFTATDADFGESITWSLTGPDASSFVISGDNRFSNSRDGQLSLASGVTIDYSTQSSYAITVIASDGTDTDSVAVTVRMPEGCLVTDLLCATLVAGTDSAGLDGYLSGVYGSLSSTEFVHDGVTYTITTLNKDSSLMYVELAPNTGTPPDSLTLYIDNDVLAFSDTGSIDNRGSTGDGIYIDWTTSVSFTDGETYTVRITGPPKAPGKMDAPEVEYVGGSSAVRVTWELPEFADRGIPLAHKLELRTRRADFKSSSAWSIRELDADATSTTHNGSLNDTYAFQVRLVNALWSVPPCTMATRHTCAELREKATGYGPWSDTVYGKVAPPCPDCPNNPPVIITAKTMTIAENTPGNFGPVRPRNNGTIRVNDADYDPITWSVSGEHGDLFNISTAEYGHGQLSVASATGLNYEDTGSIWGTYLRVFFVTLTASDGKDSDSYDIYVEVLDRAEAPGPPSAPTVTSVAKSNTSLIVTWDAPTTNTGPPVTGYGLQYKKTSESSWTPQSHTGTGVTATITGLDANTEYQVQVQASNDEGTGGWSESGAGTTVTTSAANQAPVIDGSDSVTITVAENKPDNIGSAFTATDGDAVDTITWSVGGTAADWFNISSAGRLSAAAATGLDYEEGVILQITVIASDGTASDSVAVTVMVTDVDEAPGQPDAPWWVRSSSGGAGLNSLDVKWAAPTNTGPPITGYKLQYRASKAPSSDAWSKYGQTVTGLTTTITGLTQGTSYDVQVRAINAEGAGPWSASFANAWTDGPTLK